MEFYTEEEAKFLINYYSKLLIGTSIEPPKEIFINRLELELYDGGNYRVICRVDEYRGATIISDVATVSRLNGIELPQDVLANR
ncbi:hypothetical protein [Myroides odoratus]|uniref:Uncharacterized protein n=1 Tax=Myroides odoratus TaxID=256 RepID=A0A378RN64_MYROD|nr:hypothetical protein [Myroides odoratus]QQU04774.1 hypothetical protein I6I89_05650 [Myroides odoratus]STZ27779.1 Uncharacterised protein [Myroides odoratus]